MATTYHNDIQKLYVAYFNRPADVGGLNYWEGVVEAAAGSTAAVSAAFAASPEYKAAYAGLNTSAIVNEIYNNLFGRDAETTGLNYWVGVITAGSFTIDQAVTIISEAAQGTDKVAFTSKVAAASAFTTALDTPAEQNGYSGDEANVLAKAWLAGVTTAESLASATASAALSATVTDVVKAGTPFTLSGALAALASAEKAQADFLAAVDGDNDAETSADLGVLTTARGTAATGLNTYITGFSGETSEGVQAAKIADTAKTLTGNIATAQKTHADALAAASKVTGLAGALTAAAAAEASVDAAEKVQANAVAQEKAAEAFYESKTASTIAINPNGTVTGVIEFNSSGKLVVDDAITDATLKADAATLLAAVQARVTADATVAAASTQAYYAQIQANVLDADAVVPTTELAAVGGAMTLVTEKVTNKPTASEIISELAGLNAKAAAAQAAANADATKQAAADTAKDALDDFIAIVDTYLGADANDLGDDVTSAALGLKTATDTLTAFNKAVATFTQAQANVAQYETLDAGIEAAMETFTENDVAEPVSLLAFNVATAESDIYLTSDVAAATIVNFGNQGDDALFIGTDYTLNKSTTVANGDNAKLEVFFIQVGADVEVRVETEVFGSASTTLAENVITLTGVNVADLTFANGIITAA